MNPLLLVVLVGYLLAMLACFAGIVYVRSSRGVRGDAQARPPFLH